MAKINARSLLAAGKRTIGKKLPSICAWAGVAGVVVTTVSGILDAPKCTDILEKHAQTMKDIKTNLERGEITKKEATKQRWQVRGQCCVELGKAMWRTILSGGLTIGAILGGHFGHLKKETSLASWLNTSEIAYRQLSDAAKKSLSKKDYERLEEEVAELKKQRLRDEPHTSKVYGNGDVAYHDPYSDHVIMTNNHRIDGAINRLNHSMVTGGLTGDGWETLNTFYTEIGLPRTELGDHVGWEINHDGVIEWYTRPGEYVDEQTGIITPCLDIVFSVMPHSDYDNYCR